MASPHRWLKVNQAAFVLYSHASVFTCAAETLCLFLGCYLMLPVSVPAFPALSVGASAIYLFSLQLQSYFAACEDETPAIRNHDKVLQRLCEHLDHALLYG